MRDSIQTRSETPDSPIRVLVVDDEATLRDLIKQALVRAGCKVTTAGEGGEGLQALLNSRFDVVVSDLMMEPMDGITFLTEARRIWPWMGVVVLSGFIKDDIRKRAAELGITAILEKPVSFKDLATKVLEEANRKQKRISGSDKVTLHHIQYELSLLNEISLAAIKASSLQQALRDLCDRLGQAIPSLAVGILQQENETGSLMVISTRAPVPPSFVEKMDAELLEHFKLLSGHDLSKSYSLDIQGEPLIEDSEEQADNIFSVPIVNEGTVQGMLALAPPQGYNYSDSDMSFLYHAANHLTTVLMAFQRIRELAIRDELTGLYNRHHLTDELKSVWQRAQRYGFNTGIIIIDLDHFKMINDTYGHPVGDEVLRELGQVAATICRTSDIIARYGGDELVVVLTDAIPNRIDTLAERFLVAIREHVFCSTTHELHCTVSVGAASSWTEEGLMLDPDAVLARADNALYISKRSGRDCSSVWNKEGVKAPTQSSEDKGDKALSTISSSGMGEPHVIIIDDDTAVLNIMKLLLEMEHCKATVFETASEARSYVTERSGMVDAAFVDLNLEDESGLDLIQEFRSIDAAIVTIVITGDATLDNAVNSLRHGAYDFIQKPIQREQLKITLSRALEYRKLRLENTEYQLHLEDMVRSKSRDLTNALQKTRDSFEFTLRALATMLDIREHATGAHSQRVQTISCLVAQKSGIQGRDLEDLRQGALLHDIGKIAIPDAILLKAGPLTDEEWVVMRTHAQVGYDIIKASPDLQGPAKIVGTHHEKWDGSGYPNHLSGEEIPIGARVFALADAYDAMRSDRPYRKGMSLKDSLAELKKHSGTQFDPYLVELFCNMLDKVEEIGKWRNNDE